MTTVEHRQLQSTTTDQIHSYSNCLFVCRYCNTTRGKKALTDGKGRTLLDPTVVPWSEHFTLSDCRLLALAGDRDAEYTQEAYGINKDRTVRLRKNREQALLEAFELLASRPQLLELIKLPEHAALASILNASFRNAERTISRFMMIPEDAEAACACSAASACCLSESARRQGRGVSAR